MAARVNPEIMAAMAETMVMAEMALVATMALVTAMATTTRTVMDLNPLNHLLSACVT